MNHRLNNNYSDNENNIFISSKEMDDHVDICGKITYTSVLETIPENSSEVPMKNWQNVYSKEWRWRFLKLSNNKLTVEISYLDKNDMNRLYFNRYGKWVQRNVDPIFDNYVIREHYYYSN